MSEPLPPFDLRDFTPYLLAMSSEVASLEFSQIYRSRYAMTRPEWRVLFHLGRYGSMTAREICDRAKTHKTKVSRAVRALEEKRFLERRTVEGDRRCEMLSLRSPGQAAYRDLSSEAARFEAQLTARLGDRDALLLKSLLRKLAGFD
ncbi:MarR family transcriptional regulator [Puniceibacterium sp. IMCC21224]|uniref:MarR family transcriptional regulator n=1 Tax=Puniceibacterium sp. IMCC21224 TaxID=1618204 RepID=UPI00064DB1F7|nr:MarR family transcriptional regulator [Puniceibacterium sp. IMCC21224]KMK66229.1 transcriptional regulator [Puniceibacterium sp. IMCC21224]